MTKTEEVYEYIRQSIMEGKYARNEVINELTIASKYNVSKSPAREALAMLCQEGYLVKYARKGYFVHEMTLQEYAQLIQYRIVLESAIIKIIIKTCEDSVIMAMKESLTKEFVPYLKANKENTDFHLALSKLAGNTFMTDALKSVLCKNARNTGISWYQDTKEDFHRDHRALLDAILARDEERAVALVAADASQSDLVSMINNVK